MACAYANCPALPWLSCPIMASKRWAFTSAWLINDYTPPAPLVHERSLLPPCKQDGCAGMGLGTTQRSLEIIGLHMPWHHNFTSYLSSGTITSHCRAEANRVASLLAAHVLVVLPWRGAQRLGPSSPSRVVVLPWRAVAGPACSQNIPTALGGVGWGPHCQHAAAGASCVGANSLGRRHCSVACQPVHRCLCIVR